MRALMLVLAVSAVACGGGGAPAAEPSSTKASSGADAEEGREVATGSTLTKFQRSRLLGHYSTEDGATGFILDRTASPWRAKLDGIEKVVRLEESNGPRNTREYRSAEPKMWLRVDEEGSVLLFEGPKQREGVRVVRDADAEPLQTR